METSRVGSYATARRRRTGDRASGAAGNERLTAVTGAVLLVLLAVEGATILSLRGLLTVHFFVGMLLIGPVAVKVGSTGYRFVRYYAGDRRYREKGPPAPLHRLLGPVVMLSTLALFGSGVALAAVGPGRGSWLFIHKASFVIWFCVMTVHVLSYAPRLPRLLAAELRGSAEGRMRPVLASSGTRWLLLALSLAAGLVIAALTVHLAAAWPTGPK